MSTKATKNKPLPALSCVRIAGCIDVLLPADAGIKVVSLLREAFQCRRGYDSGKHDFYYECEDEIEVEYAAVKASQVRAARPKPTEAPAPRALVHELLKLPCR